MSEQPIEEPLVGGITNAGAVVRVGPHVLRPPTANTASIHAYLRAVHAAGFDGAPEPIGVEPDGRERLTYLEGDVPTIPYPAWCQTDAALVSIVHLMRQLHDSAADFAAEAHAWSDELADPVVGRLDPAETIMCHNDLEFANIVFRDGVAVGFIDFEFAAPGRRVFDLAQMARLCVPIEADLDRERVGWLESDRPGRLRLVADAYGLDENGRAAFLAAVDDALNSIETAVRRSVANGVPGAVALWNRTGGAERYERRRRWWADNKPRFAEALA